MTNLEKWRFYTSSLESPDHFIDWNYYFMVSSCLDRRVWIGDYQPLFPNLFIVFVASPGVGKSMPAKAAYNLMKGLVTVDPKTNQEKMLINFTPNSVTYEKLLLSLAEDRSTRVVSYEDRPERKSMYTTICIDLYEEMGTLFRDKTNDIVTFLTDVWDCGDFANDTIKHNLRFIPNLCVNFLGCCVPSFISRKINSFLLSEGFLGRVIFLYGDKPRQRITLLTLSDDQRTALIDVQKHLIMLTRIKPREKGIQLTQEAFEYYDHWVQTYKNDNRLNLDRKLTDYYSRKRTHIKKMAINIHFCESLEWEITLKDIVEAIRVLEVNELTMHKALASIGRNPMNALAEEIKEGLRLVEAKSEQQILQESFNGGNKEEIDQCLSFLVNTNQVRRYIVENRPTYRINPELINEN